MLQGMDVLSTGPFCYQVVNFHYATKISIILTFEYFTNEYIIQQGSWIFYLISKYISLRRSGGSQSSEL